MKTPKLQYALLAILLTWAALAQLTESGFVIYLQGSRADRVRLPFITRPFSRSIDRVAPPYQNSGLQPNDEIVSLNSEFIDGREEMEQIPLELHKGDVLHVTALRHLPNGKSELIRVPVRLHDESYRSFGWTRTIGLNVVLPISCLLVGFFVAFRRPLDPLAWLTLAMLASFGQLIGIGEIWAIWSPWREILLVYNTVLSDTWAVWLLLFGLYFPTPFGFLRGRKWVAWLLAAPFIALLVLDLFGNFEEGNHIDKLHWLATFMRYFLVPIDAMFAMYVFGFFAALYAKLHSLENPDAARRLKFMTAGCSLALIPLLILLITRLASLGHLPGWAISLCLLMLLFFPATMAYVIVVQRAMDVRMVIRSGVRYALASTGMWILRGALAAALVLIVISLVRHSARGWQAALIIGAGIMLMAALGRAGNSLREWMDRRFFREAYDSEVILMELSNSVAGFHDTGKLLETVAHRISQSLHVPRVAVLLERGEHYQPACLLGFHGALSSVALRRDALSVRLLKQSQTASRVYFDDPQSWIHGAPEQEQAHLLELQTQLLLPMTRNNHMLGMISLGPKRSEMPYSGTDMRLLGAVASQTGLALENARLTESIRQEVAQRERINRELEIAREVQERLFPQHMPQVQGLDVAGYCRPALGVGGDYYDFIRLPDGCIGMAVGDVAGKGIAAALMMASLQASLRGQTIKPCASLAEMIQHINRLVYDASSDSRYATFFYAQYEPKSRTLTYVNAGHNSPLIYRDGEENRILRLQTGGTVIGLFPDFVYQEEQVELRPGDVLVAYTDGVSEAMNPLEEEWDEARLIAAVAECHRRSAADIVKCILDRVDAFTAGAGQHDDMTLAVMRVQ